MAKINIEIDEAYKEKLDVLRKVFVWPDGKEIEDYGKLVEWLTDTFMEFIQNQSGHDHWDEKEEGGCGTGWCGCSH